MGTEIQLDFEEKYYIWNKITVSVLKRILHNHNNFHLCLYQNGTLAQTEYRDLEEATSLSTKRSKTYTNGFCTRVDPNTLSQKLLQKDRNPVLFSVETTDDYWTKLLTILASKDPGDLKQCLQTSEFRSVTDQLLTLFKAVDIQKGIKNTADRNCHSDTIILILKKDDESPFSEHAKSTMEPFEFALEISKEISDRSSNVYRKLKQDYFLRYLHAYNLENVIMCVFATSEQSRLYRLKDDLQSCHFSKKVKQYSQVKNNISWSLEIKGDLDNLNLNSNSSESGHGGAEGKTLVNADVPKPGPVTEIPQKRRQVFNGILGNMVSNTNHTQYDLYKTLRSHKGQSFRVPTELTIDGLPLLHACVAKARYSFLAILFYFGWLPMLSRQKAAQDSKFPGMTALQIAEQRNQKKVISELKDLQAWEDSLCPVMKATRAEDYDRLSILIKTKGGEDLHYRDANNGNALFWAVVVGCPKLLNLLLNKGGIDPTMRTFKVESLLHIAASLGHAQLIPTLIRECEIDPMLKDITRKTSLDRVAENGDIETMKAFLVCGIQLDASFAVLAAFNGRKPLLEHLLDAVRVDINTKDIYNRTPLLRAIEGARFDIVQYVIEKGADISAKACTNRTVLHVAAESGDASITQYLIRTLQEKGLLHEMLNAVDMHNGVECTFLIRGRDKGRDTWHYVEVKRFLVPHFLNKSKTGNIDVASFGNVLLSGWGANPDQDNTDMIEDMFRTRRLNLRAPDDMTSLHIAIFKGHAEVAKILIDHGTPISVKDNYGLTPIMMAAAKNLTPIVKMLERKGASLTEVNNEGLSTLEIATKNCAEEVVNLIQGYEYAVQIDNFRDTELTGLQDALVATSLTTVRRNGGHVQRYIIDTLRDFQNRISETLLELGSGPIVEESITTPIS